MKIAILTSGFLPVIDGVTVAVSQRLQYLSKTNHQVLVLCPDYSPIATIYPDWQEYVGEILPHVTVIGLPSAPFMGLEFERNIKRSAYPKLLEALHQFRPDIIHVDEPERLQLGLGKIAAIDYAHQQGVPCVGFFHTNLIAYLEDFLPLPQPLIRVAQLISRRIVTRIYNAHDLTLTASRSTALQLQQMGIRQVQSDEFLGVDLAQFSPDLRTDRFFAETYDRSTLDSKLKLLFLGRLTADKGWRFTLKALPALFDQLDRQQVAVVIAGDGDLRSEILDSLRQQAIETHWLGRIPPTDVPALMANCDLHLTASQKETKGLTILEAFAAGVPVVAPRAGGVVELVQAGITGSLFTPDRIDEFVSQVLSLITDSNLRQTLGQQARASVQALSWESATDRLLAVWQAQIDRRQSGIMR